VRRPEEYAVMLHDFGLRHVHVRLQVYLHELADADAVVEWTRGSTLTRFSSALPAPLYEQFLETYRHRLLDALGHRSPFLYTFKRILMVGRAEGDGVLRRRD
jgi:trans-aconitate 2-methyltransferase